MGLYKATHINHGSTKWVRTTAGNYRWAWQHMVHLLLEHKYRYPYSPQHKTARLAYWLRYYPANIPMITDVTLPYLAVADELKVIASSMSECIDVYRVYYNRYKREGRLGTWKRRPPPPWFDEPRIVT